MAEKDPEYADTRFRNLSGEWLLTHFEPLPLTADTRITLHFDEDDQRVSGHAGCNRYFGRYMTGSAEGAIQFGEMAVTRMNCEPEVMALENSLLLAFTQITRFAVRDGMLTFYQGDNALLRARRLSSE